MFCFTGWHFNLYPQAFYSFNLVANWAYSRWSLIYPDVLDEILKREEAYMNAVKSTDSAALALLNSHGPEHAVEFVTAFSRELGNDLVQDWNSFFGKLFVKYRDGYLISANTEQTSCGCNSVSAAYPQAWYDRIAADTGDHYKTLDSPSSLDWVRGGGTQNQRSVSKIDLLNRR